MDRAALIDVWSQTIKSPVPRGLSKTLIRRFLAIEIQTRQLGGLPASLKKALSKPADKVPRPRRGKLQPGGRLLREWNGVTHVVEITQGGYVWQGQTHRSLSAIAREITGAHWSGPRFFGLDRTPKP
jgi:Protein of unknown function (DUF2924)